MIRLFELILILSVFSVFAHEPKCRFGSNSTQYMRYVRVDRHSEMFYWFFHCPNVAFDDDKAMGTTPLMIVLGSPDASATGYHNVMSLGPFDHHEKIRPHSLNGDFHLLFVDAPVGSGFSHTDDVSHLSTTNREVAEHATKTILKFFDEHPEYLAGPVHLYSESVGTRYVVKVALSLTKAIKEDSCKVNLKGVFLASPFMSPVHLIKELPDYLLARGFLDVQQKEELSEIATKLENFVHSSDYESAFDQYMRLEKKIKRFTHGISSCNVLHCGDPGTLTTREASTSSSTTTTTTTTTTTRTPTTRTPTTGTLTSRRRRTTTPKIISTTPTTMTSDYENSTNENFFPYPSSSLLQQLRLKQVPSKNSTNPQKNDEDIPQLDMFECAGELEYLETIMNQIIRPKLKCIIGSSRSYGSFNSEAILLLTTNMLKDMTKSMEELINRSKVKVTIMCGGQDLISNCPGTLKWIESMKWKHKSRWEDADYVPFKVSRKYKDLACGAQNCDGVIGHHKRHGTFSFFSLTSAGHYLFKECPAGVKTVIDLVLKHKDVDYDYEL